LSKTHSTQGVLEKTQGILEKTLGIIEKIKVPEIRASPIVQKSPSPPPQKKSLS